MVNCELFNCSTLFLCWLTVCVLIVITVTVDLISWTMWESTSCLIEQAGIESRSFALHRTQKSIYSVNIWNGIVSTELLSRLASLYDIGRAEKILPSQQNSSDNAERMDCPGRCTNIKICRLIFNSFWIHILPSSPSPSQCT